MADYYTPNGDSETPRGFKHLNCVVHSHQHMPCLVQLSSFKDILTTVLLENLNQTFGEGSRQPPLDIVTVSQEEELHNLTAELSVGHL